MPPPSPRQLARDLWEGLPALIAPVVILVGILSGVFTPTEAGLAASVYGLLVSILFYHELTPRLLVRVFIRATLSSAMIMFLIGAATVLALIVTREQIAVQAAEWLTGLTDRFWLQMLLINLFLLFVGCLIEGLPALLILIPVLLPVVEQLGVSPVHFGVILVFNLLIGIITPPMGVGLFVVANFTGLKVESIARACVPFMLPMLITLVILTYVPWMSLYLPEVLLR